jgi:hypothetical protein
MNFLPKDYAMLFDTSLHHLHIGFLGRPAGNSHFALHDDFIRLGPAAIETIKKELAASEEFTGAVGADPRAPVVRVFNNLFGRDPDEATAVAWIAKLSRGDVKIEQLVTEMVREASPADSAVLKLKVIAAESFTAALNLASEGDDYFYSSGFGAIGREYLARVRDMTSLDEALSRVVEDVQALKDLVPQPLSLAAPEPTIAYTSIPYNAPTLTEEIEALYLGFFGRPADLLGMDYWENAAGGQGTTVIRDAFAASAEWQAATQGMSAAQMVNAVYINSFGRQPEPAGLLFWTELLAAGKFSPAYIVEAIQRGATGADALTLRNKVVAAVSLTSAMSVFDTTEEILHSATLTPLMREFIGAVTADVATLDAALSGIAEFVSQEGGIVLPQALAPDMAIGLVGVPGSFY